MTTPTPRTDAKHKEELLKGNTHPTGWSFARTLELELTAKTAELYKLKRKLEESQSNCATLNVRCQMWYEDFHKLKQKVVETRAAAFEEAAAMDAEINRSFVYVSDLKHKAAAIRKGA